MKAHLLARVCLLLFALVVANKGVMAQNPDLLITEIMFHTNYDDFFEYIEIYCLPTANGTKSLAGWSITEIGFTFPSGASIAPGTYRLVVSNKVQFLRSRKSVNAAIVYGPYTTYLSNSKSTVTLVDSAGKTQVSTSYDDSDAVLADNFGSSWELRCYDTKAQDVTHHWVNSPVPLNNDRHVEYGGTPGAPNTWMACLSSADAKGPEKQMYITEIMYHPSGAISMQEDFEFIELLNNGSTSIDISNWRLVSKDGVRFLFPSGSTVAAGKYIVVAKNVSQFLSVYKLTLNSQIFGSYDGELSNGGDVIALVDNYGRVHESLEYDDKGDWPLAADAFGASQSDLYPTSPFANNYTDYLYKGLSLSRRSLSWGGSKAYNWDPKFPTPLVANFDTSANLLPRFKEPTFNPDLRFIYNTTNVTFNISLSPWPITGVTISSVVLQWFVDDVVSDTPAPSAKRNITMTEITSNSGDYTATITAANIKSALGGGTTESSVVRITIFAKFAGGQTLVSPDPTQPFQYHSFFIFPPPDPSGNTESTHLFIRPTLWASLRTNIEAGTTVDTHRVLEDHCTIRATWDANVPTTIVYSKDGRVIDRASVRYQGSRWNRVNGVYIGDAFPQGPPGGLNAYSYRLSIPRYADWDGGRDIILHKMYQGCTMYETPMLNILMEQTGVMGSPFSFVRMWINKGYLRYMMIVWSGGKDWITRFQEIQNKRCVHQTTETLGHLFKAEGNNNVLEGPYAMGDWSVQGSTCSGKWSEEQRYDYTYSRKTWDDLFASEVVNDGIHGINDNILGSVGRWSNETKKAWLMDNVDINLMLNYIVIIDWASTWDQVIHNQYMYKSAQTGKWSWHPWDADAMWEKSTSNDLYAGDVTQTVYMRRAVIQFFKSELQDRYRLFQATLHSKENMTKLLNERNAEYNRTLSAQGYGVPTQNLDNCINLVQNFINNRWDFVNNNLGALPSGVDINAELERVWCPNKTEVVRVYNTFKAIPGIPLSVSSKNLGKTSVDIMWFTPNGFGSASVSFRIQRATDGKTFTNVGTISATSVPTTGQAISSQQNLNTSTTYTFRVRSESSVGNSNWVTISITTLEFCSGFNQSSCLDLDVCRWCVGSLASGCTGSCTASTSPYCHENLLQAECAACVDGSGANSWKFIDGKCRAFPAGPCAALDANDCNGCISSSSQCGYCEWVGQSSCAPVSFGPSCSGTWLSTSCGVTTFVISTDQSVDNVTQIIKSVLSTAVGATPDSVVVTNGSTPGSYQVTVTYTGPSRGTSGTKADEAIQDATIIQVLGAEGINVNPSPVPAPNANQVPTNDSSAVVSDLAGGLEPWLWGVIAAAAAVVLIIIIIVIVVVLKKDNDMVNLA